MEPKALCVGLNNGTMTLANSIDMGSETGKSNVNKQIQENLQRVYDEALADDLPEEFVRMIERLKAEKKAKSNDK